MFFFFFFNLILYFVDPILEFMKEKKIQNNVQ